MSFHGLIAHFILAFSNIPLSACITVYHSLCIYSPMGGHLGCFQALAIVNTAALTICVRVFLCGHKFSFLHEYQRV